MKKIVLKVGGSLLYDSKLNLRQSFLSLLKDWFNRNKLLYSKIVIVVGGGKLSRFIGSQAVNFFYNSSDVHGVAMQGTQLNAQVLRGLLSSTDDLIVTPESLGSAMEYALDTSVKYIISGGVKEGWSTDMDAALYADTIGTGRVHKLSNTDYIYTADPSIDEKANIITEITWADYCKTFGILPDSIHTPNANLPIDPICANFCANKKISFFVSGGKALDDCTKLENVLESGTYVHP